MTHHITSDPEAAVSKPGDLKRDLANQLYRAVYASFELGLQRPEVTQCIEAVAQAIRLRDESNPGSVSDALLSLESHLRALQWSSPKARSIALCRLNVAMIGTRLQVNEQVFSERLLEIAIRMVPTALRRVASIHQDPKGQAALNAAADKCERNPVRDSFRKAGEAASDIPESEDATLSLAISLAADAAIYIASAFDEIGSNSKNAVVYITNSAVAAACAQGAAAAIVTNNFQNPSGAILIDTVMAKYAENVVQILRDLVPAENMWLDLVPTPPYEGVPDAAVPPSTAPDCGSAVAIADS